MDRKERRKNRTECIKSGVSISITGIVLLIVASVFTMLELFTVATIIISIEGIILIVLGAIYPTIFVVFRNKWLHRNNQYL